MTETMVRVFIVSDPPDKLLPCVACEAGWVLSFYIVATHATLNVTTRFFRVHSTARPPTNRGKAGNAVRPRFERPLRDVSTRLMTLCAKRLGRMTRGALSLLGLRINAVRESVVQVMHVLKYRTFR